MDATLDLKNVTPQLIAALYVECVKNGLIEIGITAKTEDLNLAGKQAQSIEEQEAVITDKKVKKLPVEKASKKKSTASESKSTSKVSAATESDEEETDDDEEEEDPKPSKKSSSTSKQPSNSGGTKKAVKSKPVEEDPDEDEEEDETDDDEEEDDIEIVEVPEKYNQESLRKLSGDLNKLKHGAIIDKALVYFEAETIPELEKADYENFYAYVIKKYKKVK